MRTSSRPRSNPHAPARPSSRLRGMRRYSGDRAGEVSSASDLGAHAPITLRVNDVASKKLPHSTQAEKMQPYLLLAMPRVSRVGRTCTAYLWTNRLVVRAIAGRAMVNRRYLSCHASFQPMGPGRPCAVLTSRLRLPGMIPRHECPFIGRFEQSCIRDRWHEHSGCRTSFWGSHIVQALSARRLQLVVRRCIATPVRYYVARRNRMHQGSLIPPRSVNCIHPPPPLPSRRHHSTAATPARNCMLKRRSLVRRGRSGTSMHHVWNA